MDQIKIGCFIAERRKSIQLTQAQLAEKLHITDRAVSKWEQGRSLPDSSIMLKLCEILGITVSDLLHGEVITTKQPDKESELALLDLVKQKEESDKWLLTLEWVIGILSILVLFIPIIIGALIQLEEWKRLLIVFSGFVPAFIGFFFALKIEQVAGYYECNECGHRYVPTFKAVNIAMHTGRTRYMKCPNCGKKSWQKKVVSKENQKNA